MSTDAELIALVAEARFAANLGVPDFTNANLLDRLADALEAARAEERLKTIDDACETVWLWANGHEDRFEAMNDLTHAIRNRTPSPPAKEKKT